ncbi:hypothetical protein [Kribbella deserti]|uniref:Uncharacterized protein n=1 Tax=Kribbella deserti TaxID=1926257 RepID=A0ABV6QFA2_9ACTN
MPNAVTTTDVFLEQISNQLDRVISLLEPAKDEPAASASEPKEEPGQGSDKPTPAKKAAPARKSAAKSQRRKATGQ